MPHRALSPELLDAIEAGACIVTVNQRTSHWLRLLYANHVQGLGLGAWATPDIQTFNSFVLRLWRAVGSRDERVLTTEQARLVWETVVTESKWAELLLSPQAAAAASFRSWERMQAYGIATDQLAGELEAAENIEARALAEWNSTFAQRCREHRWLPVQYLPLRLLQHEVHVDHVITLGQELVPAQRALLQHLANSGAKWQRLAVLGTGTAKVQACATEEGELQSAAQWAREQVAGGRRSVAVAVPNLNAQAALARRCLAEVFAQPTRTFASESGRSDREQQEASFTIADFRSLAEFPVVRAALDILQLALGRADTRLVSSVLRNPFLAGSTQEAAQRALTDARLRKHTREHYDLAQLENVGRDCPILAVGLQAMHAVAVAAPTASPPSALAEHFVALWRAIGWPGEQVLDSTEQQVTARLQEALGEFGALDELLGPLSLGRGVREFEQWLQRISFAPRSAPAAVLVIDVQAIEGMRFDALWVAGMNEARWPPPAAPDPFIPLGLQAQAHLPNATARLAHEQARARFEQLRHMAETVVFSWPQTEDGVQLLPSAWLGELPANFEMKRGHDALARRIFAARPALEVCEERQAPVLGHSDARGGSRIFELQSQCPFRAFAELRLGAQPLDEVAAAVDARERGTLVHGALADIWRDLRESAALERKTDAELTTLVRTALAKGVLRLQQGASAHRLRMLQIEQDIATERILSLLRLDRQRAPFRVVGTPETSERLAVGPLKFELRLDRMDELLATASAPAHGQRVIVDYKTGNTVSASSWTSDRPEQPQLPLYAVTHAENLAAVSFITLGAKGVAYKGVANAADLLPGVKAFAGKATSPGELDKPLTWEALLEHWRIVIERLASEFANGHAVVDPLPSACRYCHLQALCRIAELDAQGESSLQEEAAGAI